MKEDLSKVEQWALLSRLRQGFAVPEDLVNEISVRLNDGKYQKCMREQAERRVAFLEAHVPPEVLDVPTVEASRRVKFTGD